MDAPELIVTNSQGTAIVTEQVRHPRDVTYIRSDLLVDPNAVHMNMLRGTLAKPSVEQIVHIYGPEALALSPEVAKLVADAEARVWAAASLLRGHTASAAILLRHLGISESVAEFLEQAVAEFDDAAALVEAQAEVARLSTLEGAADRVLRFITDPDWADQNSEVFRTTPWQALYKEMQKDRGDFPAMVRTFLEAFACADSRDELRRAALLPVARDEMEG